MYETECRSLSWEYGTALTIYRYVSSQYITGISMFLSSTGRDKQSNDVSVVPAVAIRSVTTAAVSSCSRRAASVEPYSACIHLSSIIIHASPLKKCLLCLPKKQDLDRIGSSSSVL